MTLIRERSMPRIADYTGLSRSWRGDVLAGITVGVVALPLALAFGVASGVGAAAGLVTAIVAGIVAAVFGGSNLQVSGPTGAMAVVLMPIVARFGVGAVVPVAIMAGVMVLAMGLFGLGRIVDFIPWPVVEGFTIGIATIIFLQQVPFALGVPKPEGENTAVVAFRSLQEGQLAAGRSIHLCGGACRRHHAGRASAAAIDPGINHRDHRCHAPGLATGMGRDGDRPDSLRTPRSLVSRARHVDNECPLLGCDRRGRACGD